MPEMLPEASGALHRISMGDSLVVQDTIPMFMSHLTAFAQTSPDRAEVLQSQALDLVASSYGYGPSRDPDRPYVFSNGVAVVPVHGILLNRFNSCWGFATGYNFLRAQLNAVLEDAESNGGDVRLLAWDVNSPGGEAVGCFELCAEIFKAREVIPMISVVDSLAASGGYAIGCAPQRMVCTPSGSVGSIGVYRLHVNISKALEQMGIEYTIFQAGEHKTDGNPYGAPSAAAAEEFQRGVEKRWDEFIAVVAEQRDMDPERVRDTQARVYRADEALDLQLIDAVNTPSEAVSEFLAELASDNPLDNGDDEMALPKNETEYQAALQAARDEGKASVSVPNVAQETAAAVAADRQRRKDIMALPEASNRQKLATTLADSDATVEFAKTVLGSAAEEKAETTSEQKPTEQQQQEAPKPKEGESQSEFQKRMDGDKHPNIQSQPNNGGGNDNGGLSEDEKAAAMILGDQARFSGAKHRDFKIA